MNTYRIRTHNPVLVTLAMIVGLLAPIFFVKFWNNGVLNDKINGFLNGFGSKYLEYIPPCVLFFAVYLICYYFICTIIVVTTSEEGVHARWCQSFPYFKKVEKTIKWTEILNFNAHVGGSRSFIEGIIIETQNDVEYKFFSMTIFFRQRSFKEFLKDFRSHVTLSAGRDDMRMNPDT